MKRWILCLLLLWACPVQASTPYVVSGVTVDVTADTLTDARNQAIIEGQRKAFMNLATQLAPGESIPQVSDTQIGNMISDFRVDKEQYGDKRYVATLVFRFRPNPVRQVFGAQAIPSPSELMARGPVVTQTTTTTVITSKSETPEADGPQLPPVAAAPKPAPAAEVASVAVTDASSIIQNEAAQPLPPVVTPVAADNPMPPGVDINSPLKLMLIEADPVALRNAQEKLRTTPGVVDLSYSGRTLHMAYRGETSQLVSSVKGQGVNLKLKLPTQPPIYTVAQ